MIKRKFLKILSVFAAVTVAGGICAAGGRNSAPMVLDAGAVYEAYGMTSEYKSGRYYQNLVSLSLSGDQSRDVIAIALSQLGYHEGNSDADFSGEKKEGSRDFVEYNVLYGKLDNDQGNGLSHGYYWCASFVNWCFRQAGIPEEATAGAEVSCQRWINDCKSQGIFVSKSGYVPREGDMIFFKDNGSSVDSTHVGLVRYSDGNKVYTVEGNTSNGGEYSSNGEYVALKSHSLSSSYIVGYVSPKYTENKSAQRVDRSSGFFSAGQYISLEELSVFYDSNVLGDLNKSIPSHTVFTVTDAEGDALKVSYNGVEGYVEVTDSVIQLTTSQNVYTVNYLNEEGQQIFMTQYCVEGQEKSIYSNSPKREKSGFVGWKSTGSDKILSPGESLGVINEDVALTSVWDENYYIVTFKDADGTVISQAHGYYGTEYDIPEPPKAPEGFVFFGWGDGADGIIRGNASYTAEFVSEDELESVVADTEKASETETESDGGKSGCSSSVSGAAIVLSSLSGIAMFIKKKNK